MALDDMLDDGETKPGAAGLAAPRGIDAVKALGDSRQMLARNARAIVCHGEGDPRPASRRRQPHSRAGSAAAVAHCIAEEVVDYLKELRPVAADRREVGRDI